jgi:hypothetical protein
MKLKMEPFNIWVSQYRQFVWSDTSIVDTKFQLFIQSRSIAVAKDQNDSYIFPDDCFD